MRRPKPTWARHRLRFEETQVLDDAFDKSQAMPEGTQENQVVLEEAEMGGTHDGHSSESDCDCHSDTPLIPNHTQKRSMAQTRMTSP
jgi:hypothetical protein